MTIRIRPNSGVSADPGRAGGTRLVYAPRVNPAPLAASGPGNPVLATLEVVITNPHATAAQVDSITFTFPVGGSAGTLTPSASGILTDVSDPTTWQVASSAPAEGVASYKLDPVVGAAATLEPGASVVVWLYQIRTNEVPGTARITIKEMLHGPVVAFDAFEVTTFPAGFYFNGLTACAGSGSTLAPVAQVPAGSTVTLTWNGSQTAAGAYTVFYSLPGAAQQAATPSVPGEWTSPQLTADTVFTVQMRAAGVGGQPVTAAMTVPVAVQNPALVANSLKVGTPDAPGTAEVNGTATIQGTLNAVTVSSQVGYFAEKAHAAGELQAGSATVQGALTAGSATVQGALTADTAAVQGELFAGKLQVSGNAGVLDTLYATNLVVTTGEATVSHTLNVGQPSTRGTLNLDGTLNVGGWAFGQDADGNLTISNGGKVLLKLTTAGVAEVGGQRALRHGDTVNLQSSTMSGQGGYLNGSKKIGWGWEEPSGWIATTYWSNDPDEDSDLTIRYGNVR